VKKADEKSAKPVVKVEEKTPLPLKPAGKEPEKKDIKKIDDPKADKNIKPAEPKQSPKILLSSSSSSSSKHKKSPVKPAGPAKIAEELSKKADAAKKY
jgi:hypothetical protein